MFLKIQTIHGDMKFGDTKTTNKWSQFHMAIKKQLFRYENNHKKNRIKILFLRLKTLE